MTDQSREGPGPHVITLDEPPDPSGCIPLSSGDLYARAARVGEASARKHILERLGVLLEGTP